MSDASRLHNNFVPPPDYVVARDWTAQDIADALGGDVDALGVLAPGEGHSAEDRSLRVMVGDEYPHGFFVTSFSNGYGDWRALRAYVESQCPFLLKSGTEPIHLTDEERAAREAAKAARDARCEAKDASKRSYYLEMWETAKPVEETLNSVVHTYLGSRGIEPPPGCLRDKVLRYKDAWAIAMMAEVISPTTGERLGLHITFLGTSARNGTAGRKVKWGGAERITPKLTSDRKAVGVIKLVSGGRLLCIAEGVETALSFQRIPKTKGATIWAGVNSSSMARLEPLNDFDSIMVAVDIEPSGVGRKAALELAERWAAASKPVYLLWPGLGEEKKLDLNDVVRVDGGPREGVHYQVQEFEPFYQSASFRSKQAAYGASQERADVVCAASIVMRPKDWLWKGHLLRGAQELLTGIPGLGKSQVQIHFVSCVTKGLKWPDGAAAKRPANVIMLTAEDTLDQELVPRLIAAGADLQRVHILKSIKTDKRACRQFLLNEDLGELEKLVNRIGDVALVTIDPITAYMGSKIDSHKTTEVRAQLGPLKDFAERMNVAVSTITHPPKSAGQKAIDHYIGSQAFIAAGRIGHVCVAETEPGEDEKPKPTGRILFANAKNNPHILMPTLAYRISEMVIGQDRDTHTNIAAPRVIWDAQPVEINADQAIAASNGAAKSAPRGAQAAVRAFVREILKDGPVAARKVQEAAKRRGITDSQLKTAREGLRVASYKEGQGGWIWQWSEDLPF